MKRSSSVWDAQNDNQDAPDLMNENDDETTRPGYVRWWTFVIFLVASVAGVALAVGSYLVFSQESVREQVISLFATSSTARMLFWVIAGLVTGFLLIGIYRLAMLITGWTGISDEEDTDDSLKE